MKKQCDENREERKLTKVLLPTVLETTFMAILALTESVMAGALGKDVLSALGLAVQPRLMAYTISSAANVGLTAVIARMNDQEKERQASFVLKKVIGVSLAVSAALALFMLLFPDRIIRLAGGWRAVREAQIMDSAVRYIRIAAMAFPLQSVTMCICAALRGKGLAKYALLIQGTAGIVQMASGAVLMFGVGFLPALELTGAAIAVCIGWSTGLIVGICLKRRFICFSSTETDQSMDASLVKNVYRISGYNAAEQFLNRIGYIVSGRFLFGLGTDLFAANQICQQITTMIYAIGDGFAVSGAALAGNGNENKRCANRITRYCIIAAVISGVIMGSILFVFNNEAVMLFIMKNTNSLKVTEEAAKAVRVIALLIPIQLTALCAAGFLRAMGKNRYVTIVSVLTTAIFRPVMIYMALRMNKNNLAFIWLMALTEVPLRFVLLVPVFLKKKKGTH